MRVLFLLPLAVLLSAPAAAQFSAPASPCPPGVARAWLTGINVEAELYTNGNLFYSRETYTDPGYVVPLDHPNGPTSVTYGFQLWIGGRVDGDKVRVAAERYTYRSFRPGRTGPEGVRPDSSACAQADRIWQVAQSGAPRAQGPDIAEWPAHLGAPVIDGDGVLGNYDLARGDRPGMRGDATAFWAMTDTATERLPGERPLGVDVTVEAFVLYDLPTTTFYHYTVTNRNDVPIEETYIGSYLDWDLGNATDDYVASDTTAQMAYVYNAFETDTVYGVPPAAGWVVARGPLAEANGLDDDRDGTTDEPGERMGMTRATPIHKATRQIQEPQTPEEFYNRMRGLWNDGTPVYEYGDGSRAPAGGAPTTVFAFPGDPVAGALWSTENIDGQGQPFFASDKWGMIATGPVNLEPGASMETTFALVYAQGGDRLDSVTRLREQARTVRQAAEAGALDIRALHLSEPPPDTLARPVTIRRPRPNPFHDATTVEIQDASGANARVSVYDPLGRLLSTTEVAAPEARVAVGRGLAAGIYVVRVEGTGFAEAFPIVKVR